MYINNNSNNRIAQSELFGEWGNDNDNDDDNDDGDWKKIRSSSAEWKPSADTEKKNNQKLNDSQIACGNNSKSRFTGHLSGLSGRIMRFFRCRMSRVVVVIFVVVVFGHITKLS